MFTEFTQQLRNSFELYQKSSHLFSRRSELANTQATARFKEALADAMGGKITPQEFWSGYGDYVVDFAQRSVLFMDTLRQRGNNYLEHVKAGQPPLLHFDYEVVLDARKFETPVNYMLLKIIPPAGVKIDPKLRPYIIIDPRAGHGPGIGGFKDDSQVGVALREGHPVYFVSFHPKPEPGQTLLDVCEAERRFVAEVRRLHPHSPKPVLVGNCQGGWAAMMLAASNPEDTGPIVINGAPMSYWGGAFKEGEGDNPMRYAGGMLGGSWLSSLTADLGNGVFDGAWLVQNFENLHPSNSMWDKYYHVFANIDTEPPRFLEFERWWGGFFLMNREEIEWIVRNLFVGNTLWEGDLRARDGDRLDLRAIRSPIILFASMGDNITPPQQAFNWVADVYASTDDIKANGQVIVGMLHENIGHLGIFVSGKVAKKEHAQIVEVMKSIESLPPGLYAMKINEEKGAGGKIEYSVEFVEHRLEDISQRLNKVGRKDENIFEAVAEISKHNQRSYEMFVRPWVKMIANEPMAQALRTLHPLRLQRWILSDLNPMMAWLGPVAAQVKAQRRAVPADAPLRKAERFGSSMMSSLLDFYRDMRDGMTEKSFFELYGNLFLMGVEDPDREVPQVVTEPRQLAVVKEALAAIERGGYAEALVRTAALIKRHGQPFLLEQIELKRDLEESYAHLLPKMARADWRQLRGVQEIICRYEPARALASLPKLLSNADERSRYLALLDALAADPRFIEHGLDPSQQAIITKIRASLAQPAVARGAPKAAPKAAAKAPVKAATKPAAKPRAASKSAAKPVVAKAASKAAPKPAPKSAVKASAAAKPSAAPAPAVAARNLVAAKPVAKPAAKPVAAKPAAKAVAVATRSRSRKAAS
ncbi:DUF3141 domain-containing protein [Uliginosibacterium sp. TH139]|uniref:DUF3141 domain-containing protein n=1 Tax=Uliginosibacterium sp. TH139 TaxID=2067453 RepID=UPI000C7C00A9|nr:DUF3141 domain-containing protein [Uliginosibacterium sp. TH139]PLK49771.1 poly(3-hydroxybutyrate) depolymerase [Uliginosibacterium sp. TH139]